LQWSEDGEYLYCQNKDFISILSISKGTVVKLGKTKYYDREDIINSFTISKDGKFIVTHHKSSLFKLWSGKGISIFSFNIGTNLITHIEINRFTTYKNLEIYS
jgi:6-phosphogluconolactonase (cycloisomerase 2 family)